MKDTAKFWDAAAAKYAKSPIENMDGYNRTLDLTRKYLTPSDRVLELGCGTGSTALLLAENVKDYVASDVSPNMIEIGIGKSKDAGIENIEFVVSNVMDVDTPTQSYDAVLAFNILHLLEDLSGCAQKVNSLLKPGGLFVSKTFSQMDAKAPLKYKVIKMLLPLMQLLGKAPYVNFMGVKVLEDTIVSAGFEIVEAGDYPTRFIVARKI